MFIKIKVGNEIREIKLSDEVVEEFDLKFRSIGIEKNLEDFIVNDISSLIEGEIDNGLYGLFNY